MRQPSTALRTVATAAFAICLVRPGGTLVRSWRGAPTIMRLLAVVAVALLFGAVSLPSAARVQNASRVQSASRERVSLDSDWRFKKDDAPGATLDSSALRTWLLPTSNPFIKDVAKRHVRPNGNLGDDIPYTQRTFDDSAWRRLDLPHDWGIEGSFSSAGSGGTGRLPFYGAGWYRKILEIPAGDAGRSVFLDVDGAMSYAAVWLNGRFVGGWPYGYASWRVNLTPYLRPRESNILAIRLDNPPNSSRWYPGGGIYRHVWLVKTARVHVGLWGTTVTTPNVSATSATVAVKVNVDNDSPDDANVRVSSEIVALNARGERTGRAVAAAAPVDVRVPRGSTVTVGHEAAVRNPLLWGPVPRHTPNRYVVVTTVEQNGAVVDRYETLFGIRTLKFDPTNGFSVNGERVALRGVCMHHDLGPLGTALNERALRRQLEMLVEMGVNAIRTSHNPPAPELLDFADQMGLLVMDETMDVWRRQKTPLDYHLLFDDWHEQDTRMLIRRDRNHPSVIMWSVGNEVGEQGQGDAGADVSRMLTAIVHDEDPTRPTTSAMNSAPAGSPFAASVDLIGLNYQGTGVRGAPPQYPVFREQYPKTSRIQTAMGRRRLRARNAQGCDLQERAAMGDERSENNGTGVTSPAAARPHIDRRRWKGPRLRDARGGGQRRPAGATLAPASGLRRLGSGGDRRHR